MHQCRGHPLGLLLPGWGVPWGTLLLPCHHLHWCALHPSGNEAVMSPLPHYFFNTNALRWHGKWTHCSGLQTQFKECYTHMYIKKELFWKPICVKRNPVVTMYIIFRVVLPRHLQRLYGKLSFGFSSGTAAPRPNILWSTSPIQNSTIEVTLMASPSIAGIIFVWQIWDGSNRVCLHCIPHVNAVQA